MCFVSAPTTPPTEPVSPSPRRVALPRWLDARLVLGVVLVLASVLVGARIVAGADTTYALAAPVRDLAAGTVLTSGDLTTVSVRVPDHGRSVYVQHPEQAVGKVLTRDVGKGQLLPVDAIRQNAPHTTISMTFDDGAAPPGLRAGDRITVWLSTPKCRSVVLLADVTVQGVHDDNAGTFSGGDGGQAVVVDVDPDVAQHVVPALSDDDAKLRAGVLSGARSTTTGAAQPDLDTCFGSSASGSGGGK